MRADGWCGECAGYTTPTPATPDPNPTRHWYWGKGTWRPAALDLDSDEAYEVDIHPGVVDFYSRHHGGTRKAAILDIRGLLEDLITADARTETDEEGNYRIYLKQAGYGLMLTADRGEVVRYRTKHRERTWPQFRKGVKSRPGASIPARLSALPAWQRGPMSTLPIQMTSSAFNSYARHSLGVKVTQDNITTIVEQLTAHLVAHVLPKWQHTEQETVDDGHGRTWLLAVNSDAQDGVALANFATDTGHEERTSLVD
ncbi:hypothetical protein [Streptomyces sp. SP17KL33]|uniref:hypothetical protein n=1 Tax=Streptomyces sp. SP17KL33 TaxID=3002534 RepID=UPI002E78F6F7|nr:hypothetical protein [Streptomyces sp. SP17KL33]MEE1838100.1 hypothetical protein [Streptomyces sp. SP17KL33]